MESIARLSEVAQRVLVERPKELERSLGFVQRSTAQIDGPALVQMGVLGWLHNAAASKNRRYWISGVKASMLFRDGQGCWWNLTRWVESQPAEAQVVDEWVHAGQQDQVPLRLIALRLPPEVVQRRAQRANRTVERRPHSKGIHRCGRRPKRGAGRQPRQRARKRHTVSAPRQRLRGWLLVLTNVEASVLDARHVAALLRLRWQLELFWKLCKQEGKIDTWRSAKPWRILTELYAKLLGVLLAHWVSITGCWADPRRSLFKAQQVVQFTIAWLVLAIRGVLSWEVAFAQMAGALGPNCWTDRRLHPPSTFQQLEDPQLCSS